MIDLYSLSKYMEYEDLFIYAKEQSKKPMLSSFIYESSHRIQPLCIFGFPAFAYNIGFDIQKVISNMGLSSVYMFEVDFTEDLEHISMRSNRKYQLQ